MKTLPTAKRFTSPLAILSIVIPLATATSLPADPPPDLPASAVRLAPPDRPAASAPSAPADQPPAQSPDKLSITSGAFTPAGGKLFPYTATAGYMPLKDESGKLRARIFYVAYTAGEVSRRRSGDAPPATAPAPATQNSEPRTPNSELRTQNSELRTQNSARPLIFLFNGGPGAAAVWLHLAVGPRRLDVPDDGTPPKPPYRVIENPYSWLAAADLVFVDPVNTGYSRAADPEKAKEFFGVKEDIQSMGEFVRLYLSKYQRWGSPIYLAGESYGTTRVAGLAPYLQDRVGASVSGIILMSTVLDFSVLSPKPGNDLPYPLDLPTYAALAFYHHKAAPQYKSLDDILKDAESFALNDYTVALAKGSSLPDDQRQQIAQKLSALTGLPLTYILQSDLRIPPSRFEKELLKNDPAGPRIIGRFDGRLTGASFDPVNDSVEYDPALAGFYPAYTSAFNEYVRKTLDYHNDLPYEVLSGRTQPWNFDSGGTNGYLYVGDNLARAMTADPHLKVLVCAGRYDLATPYFGVLYTLHHLGLAPELQKNITETFYPAGHMMYHVKSALESLTQNVTTFIEK